MLAPISSTNTSRSAWISPATRARQATLKNSSLSLAPTLLFFCSIPGALASEKWSSRSPEDLPPSAEILAARRGWPPDACARRPQKLCGTLFHLGFGAGSLLRGEWSAFIGQLGVALDRRAAHPKGASCLALGHAPSEGFDYLLPEVFRIGVHAVHDATWTICVANCSRAEEGSRQ